MQACINTHGLDISWKIVDVRQDAETSIIWRIKWVGRANSTATTSWLLYSSPISPELLQNRRYETALSETRSCKFYPTISVTWTGMASRFYDDVLVCRVQTLSIHLLSNEEFILSLHDWTLPGKMKTTMPRVTMAFNFFPRIFLQNMHPLKPLSSMISLTRVYYLEVLWSYCSFSTLWRCTTEIAHVTGIPRSALSRIGFAGACTCTGDESRGLRGKVAVLVASQVDMSME